MSAQLHSSRPRQRGLVLVSSLLLLLVITILALAMFRSTGLSEKISGNMRETERALHETLKMISERTSGDRAKARSYYDSLLALCGKSDTERSELLEARRYLTQK